MLHCNPQRKWQHLLGNTSLRLPLPLKGSLEARALPNQVIGYRHDGSPIKAAKPAMRWILTQDLQGPEVQNAAGYYSILASSRWLSSSPDSELGHLARVIAFSRMARPGAGSPGVVPCEKKTRYICPAQNDLPEITALYLYLASTSFRS